MPLIKRRPRKLIRVAEAAEMLGYKDGKTIRRMVENGIFKGIRMNEGPTTPIFVYEAEILEYREKREFGRREF